jgi:hypothetical protein
VDRLDGYAREGMTLVVRTSGDGTQLDDFMARAQADGIRVLLQPNANWQNGDFAALRAFVLRYRENPALYGWYLADEPDFTGLPPAPMVGAYNLIKSLDSHPVAAVFTVGMCGLNDLYTRYLKGFDLLMYDDYPFYTFTHGREGSREAVREVQITARNCVRSARYYHKLGPIMVLQGFGQGVKDGPFSYRDPTYAEEKAMFWNTVHARVKAILFWSDQFADRSVGLRVRRVVVEWRGPHAVRLPHVTRDRQSGVHHGLSTSRTDSSARRPVSHTPVPQFSRLLFSEEAIPRT